MAIDSGIAVVSPPKQHTYLMPKWLEPKLGFLSSASENRESFFARIGQIFPPTDPRYKLIEKAYDVAKDAFEGVYRDEGVRYFEHLRAVALILIDYMRVRDEKIIAAALLHDIMEDCREWPFERIVRNFGEEIATLVWWLSKQDMPGLSKEEADRNYHTQLANAPREAIIIKMADRLHNLMTIWVQQADRIGRKISETLNFVIPLAERHMILLHELEDMLDLLAKQQKTL